MNGSDVDWWNLAYVFDQSEKKENPPAGHTKLPVLDICDVTDCKNLSIIKVDSSKFCEKHFLEYKEKTQENKNQRKVDNSTQNTESQETPETFNPVKYETPVLPLDAILCDHRKNFARHGKQWLTSDKEVRDLAHLINCEGLLNPAEVRKLDQPIERDTPTKYAKFYEYEIVSGFCRFVSLKYLGRTHERFSVAEEMDDDQALIHNGIENWGRKDPTEFDLAMYIALVHRKRGWSAETIAKKINVRASKVEEMISIVEFLPEDLLDIFRVSPTAEIRRELYRVSLIRMGTKEESQAAMIEEWNRIQALKNDSNQALRSQVTDNSKVANPVRNKVGDPNKSVKKAVSVRNQQIGASQYYSVEADRYLPVNDEMRNYADNILRFLINPKSRNPFR